MSDNSATYEITICSSRKPESEAGRGSISSLFARAKALEGEGAVAEAVKIYQQLVVQKPQAVGYRHRLAEALVQQGELSAALEHLTRAIDLRPDTWILHLRLAEVLLQRGEEEDLNLAVAAFQRVIALNSQSARAYRGLGDLLRQQGHIEEAVTVYQQLVKLQPSFSTYSRLSQWLIDSQQFEKAIAALEEVIRLRPEFTKAYHQLGYALIQLRRYDAALLTYQRLITVNVATDRQVIFDPRPGDLLVQQGEMEAAIAYYQTLLSFAPQESRAYYSLGLIYEQQQDWARALECLLKALECAPSFIRVHPALMRIADRYLESVSSRDASLGNGDIPSSVLRLFRSSTNWTVLTQIADGEGCDCRLIIPALEVKLPAPKSIEPQLYASSFESQCNISQADVAVVREGRGYADRWTSAVITQKQQLLSMFSTGRANLIVSSSLLPKPTYLTGHVAFLSARLGSRCYYHWMLEVLPRFELLRMAGFNLDAIDYFVLLNCGAHFCQESLQAIGIPASKVVDSLEHPFIQAEQLLVSSVVGNFKSTNWATDFLKRTFLVDRPASGLKRIYISRRKATKRKVSNEDEVTALLEQYGFHSVVMESLSLTEQATLMAEAEAIVGIHGSGMANTIFCQPGTKIVELFSPVYVNPCYQTLCSAIGMDYYYLVGQSPKLPISESTPAGAQNVFIDPRALLELIDLAGLT